VEDAVGDGDDGAITEDGRDKEEELRQKDDHALVAGWLLLKVFENELEDEDEEREGKEEDEVESKVVTRLRIYYAIRFRENIPNFWSHGVRGIRLY